MWSGVSVHVSADGYVAEKPGGLVSLYNDWLDTEIALFSAIREAMHSGRTYEAIAEEMKQRFHIYDTGDRIASLANVEKPLSLFSLPNAPIYHGATQFPWYAEILQEWQEENCQ